MRRDVNKYSILIVEDSRTLAKYLVRKLHTLLDSVQIDVVSTYAELKSLLSEKQDYDLALLDIYLPDMQDEELVDFVLTHDIPSVIMTGTLDSSLYEKFIEKEIVDFVLKDSAESLDYIVNLTSRLLQNIETTVMVVDDSVVIRKQIEAYLQNQLYSVKTEENPLKALEYLENDKSREISIVISDYYMPEMDGVEFLQKLRRCKKKDELGIIGISSDTQSATMFLKYGANDFINKPFDKQEFVHRVNNLAQNLENVAKLKAFANQDFLTKLSNRKYFFEQAHHYLKRVKRDDESYAVAMIDIDNFKSVNDTYGHDIGDKVIKALANVLKGKTKGEDLVARFGGEEFCLLLKNIPSSSAEAFFNQVCIDVSNLQVEVDVGQYINFTVSIGLETEPHETLDDMIKQADIFLYEAKQSGKNRVVTHSSEIVS